MPDTPPLTLAEPPIVSIGEPEFGYTVNLEYKPSSKDDLAPWRARVSIRGREITTKWGRDRDDALAEVRHWIKVQQKEQVAETVHLDANGDPVPTSTRV